MRGRIRRSLPALMALLTLGVALAAAGTLVLAGMLAALRRETSDRPRPLALSARSRRVRPALAGALLALLVWVLPWLSLHDTHHALERGEPTCQVAQIAHSQGGGILPPVPVLALPPLADRVPVPAPVALSSRSAPPPSARSPPV